jgi:HPt (histidine-containing phosphotransfer) domain-containing protein
MAVMKTLTDANNHTQQTVKIDHAPPLAPIDLAHLARMTLGEPNLEHEVLGLFDRQAAMLLARMTRERPRAIAAFAHTLTGSARGVGAWRVADAAETVERLAAQNASIALGRAIARLTCAVEEARAVIAQRQTLAV